MNTNISGRIKFCKEYQSQIEERNALNLITKDFFVIKNTH